MASYIDFLVHGDDRDLIPYLTGYLAASKPFRVVFAAEAGFHIRQMRERIRHHGEVQHVVTEARHTDLIRKALSAAGPRYRFEIKAEHPFEQAQFAFRIDTPSRTVAEKVRTIIATLPAGVAVSGFAPVEFSDPKASSTELYSPEHDYRFAGKGAISGDVFAVVDTRATLRAVDFVDCGEIEIENLAR